MSATPSSPGPAPQRARILIVDDEPAVRLTLEMALADTPHQVGSVDTAEKALSLLQHQPLDLLIVDKNLPGLSGVELIRRVRQESAEVICAMITGYPSADSAMEMLQLGVRGYLEKPFDDVFQVVKRIETMLEGKRTADTLRNVTQRLQGLSGQIPGLRPLTLHIVTPYADERAWLTSRTGEVLDRVEAVASSAEWLGRLARTGGPAPDLIVADASLRDPELPLFMEAARRVHPEVQFAIVCMAPSLGLITQLIDSRAATVVTRPLSEAVYRSRLLPTLRRIRLGAAPPPITARQQQP